MNEIFDTRGQGEDHLSLTADKLAIVVGIRRLNYHNQPTNAHTLTHTQAAMRTVARGLTRISVVLLVTLGGSVVSGGWMGQRGLPRRERNGSLLLQSNRDDDDAVTGACGFWYRTDEVGTHENRLLQDLRGGASAVLAESSSGSDDEQDEKQNDDDDEQDKDSPPQQQRQQINKEPVPITIQTAVGNDLLDQTVELPNVHRSRTLASLKESCRRQLPGKPPVSSMRFVLDGKILDDDVLVQDLLDDEDDEDEDDETSESSSPSSLLTLTLDMIPPVDPQFMSQVQQRLPDMTPSQLLEAFCVNEAALLRNAGLLERDYKRATEQQQQQQQQAEDESAVKGEEEEEEKDDESTLSSDPAPTSFLYLELREEAARMRRDLEQTVLGSESQQKVLRDDQPPSAKQGQVEIRGQRIRSSRPAGRTAALRERVQRNLNVQWADTIRYCVLFLFFGYFGGRTATARAILLLGAPSVFVLQARPVKLWIKQVLYAVLDHPPGIFLSLLPAPQQAILNLDVAEAMRLLYGSSVAAQETKGTVDEEDGDVFYDALESENDESNDEDEDEDDSDEDAESDED